jgi:hypothetical protein
VEGVPGAEAYRPGRLKLLPEMAGGPTRMSRPAI